MSGSFSGVVAAGGGGGIALTDLSAVAPLIYNSGTGAFSADSDLTSIAALATPSVRSILTEQTNGAWTFMATDSVAFTGGSISGTVINLPTAGSGVGALLRNVDVVQYRDSTNALRTLLSGESNLINLTDTSVARANIGLALTTNYVAVVTITSTTAGTYGLTINGTAISTSTGGSPTISAAAVVTAIQANGTTNALVTASSAAGVITITAIATNTVLAITGLTAPSPATMVLTSAVPVLAVAHLGTGGLNSNNFLRGNGTFTQVLDGNVSSIAAIAWSKISKSGAVPSDVGAGTIATQNANSVAITGGAISGTALNLPASGTGVGALWRNTDVLQFVNSTSNTSSLLDSRSNPRAVEIDSLFSAAPVLSIPRKNAAGTAIEYATPAVRILDTFTGTTTLTGTTAETTLRSFTLPGGLSVGTCVEIFIGGNYTGTAGIKTIFIRPVSLGTSFIHGQGASTTVTGFTQGRRFFIESGSTIGSPATGLATPDAGNFPGPYISHTVNTSIDQTFFVSAVLANSADSVVLRYMHVRLFTP